MMCDLGGIDVALGNTFLHYYGVEVGERPSMHVVMVGADRKPKLMPFTQMPNVDGIGINLVIAAKFYEEQFILILQGEDLTINMKENFPK